MTDLIAAQFLIVVVTIHSNMSLQHEDGGVQEVLQEMFMDHANIPVPTETMEWGQYEVLKLLHLGLTQTVLNCYFCSRFALRILKSLSACMLIIDLPYRTSCYLSLVLWMHSW